ncbi:MAG: hercynylcysteine S-oxide lyase, partial [Actinomycetota bacterium]|nr:hercynylcysteine S-oxide lyase [Actinomycetota bacterium]
MSLTAWVADRIPTDKIHLDVAACGRVSQAALSAECAHLRLEAEVGGYVAEVAAAPVVEAGRAALGAMVGLDGADVVFSEGGGLAFAVLLDAWPLPPGSRIGMVPSEYGGNARVLRDRAPQRGWELVLLPVDDLGRILEVPSGLDLVTFPHVA